MSLRAFGKGNMQGKTHDQAYMRMVYEIISNKGCGFLLPVSFQGCKHEWKQLDSGYCVCEWCGKEHNCYRGDCPEITGNHSERVCSITGCVIVEGELMAERSSNERTGMCANVEHLNSRLLTSMGTQNKVLALFGGGSKLRETVESTVREILASDKTEQCMVQERKRYDTKLSALFSKALREASHDHKCVRPNMVLIYSQVEYQCRKNRHLSSRFGIDIGHIIENCTESITSLLISFGGVRVTKQMQNSARCREFICSIFAVYFI
jgi:hypothetical protein